MKAFKPGEVTYDLRATFCSRLVNVIGSDFFRSIIVRVIKTDERIDVCENGLFSCHVFTSNFLKMHDLIGAPCANVESLEKGLINASWQLYWQKSDKKICELHPLSVLIWEPKLGSDGQTHKHSGFYVAGTLCISNDPRTLEQGSTGRPIFHQLDHTDLGLPPRCLEKAYFHPVLV